MTKEELEAIGAREKAATLGPWRECGSDRGGCSCCIVWSTSADIPVADTRSSVGCDMKPNTEALMLADAAFVAHARTDVPALLTYVAELEQDRNLYKTAAESKETLYETACAGRESAQKRVANLERAIDDFITAAKGTRS